MSCGQGFSKEMVDSEYPGGISIFEFFRVLIEAIRVLGLAFLMSLA